MIIAQQNGRTTIGAPDKLFGVSSKAKERIAEIGKENVIDSTIGVLLNDEGKLVVLESVMDCIRSLSPEDYAAYAPITGLPAYQAAVKEAVFLGEVPEGVFVESCYTPGGTGALRNAVSAYTKPGDKILTSDWHWNPYNLIAAELGRSVQTYQLFDNEDKFNGEGFEAALTEILAGQDETLVIVNTPAHNPTGYTFTENDWNTLLDIIKKFPEKKIALLVDIAYLDFAGDPKEYRFFLPMLAGLPENILPLIAFSASKGYTMYGMRCGALLCMASSAEIAKEFKDVMSVECRASWSNGNRAAMTVLAKIFEDKALRAKVDAERTHWMEVLAERGGVFMKAAEEAGLTACPYDSGFFITIPCDHAEEAGKRLQDFNIFAIPMGRGIRVSVASNTVEECKQMPAKIKQAIDESK
ncbi:pyridoxal phosphate-dependent aminotransferase [Ihubacter sp. mB4P-1]|uniref:pyridoxal phosphate-dependent aminotransferase n=1 Tax=Ihubacter sp. mB4P-1 TaxID=3242370 RepID=UPI00137A759B